ARRGGQWLDWFDDQGIAGVGMGMITLRAPRRGEKRPPEHILEEITGADEALTGPEVDAFFARREFLHDTSNEKLLATRLSTAPVFLEEHSLPGAQGWEVIGAAVRRPGGPGAAIGVDEVSRALFAGCRGEVPLGALIELLAAHHGVDAGALGDAAMP
ncbi:methyltransferase, partial [Mycobacterium sp. ITM-2017-0098]